MKNKNVCIYIYMFFLICTHTHFFLLSGWFVFMFCDISFCRLIFFFYEKHLSEILQNNLYESKESFQMKVEMLL